jgi:hypothetical protein
LMDLLIWLTDLAKICKNSLPGLKNFSMSSTRTTRPTASNQCTHLFFRQADTLKTPLPLPSMTLSNTTTNFCWPRSSRLQPRKKSDRYFHTRTRLTLQPMMPNKSYSRSTGLNLTKYRLPTPQLTLSTMTPSKLPRIRRWLLSGHNSDNNPGARL